MTPLFSEQNLYYKKLTSLENMFFKKRSQRKRVMEKGVKGSEVNEGKDAHYFYLFFILPPAERIEQ